jgi:thiol-disulfide isomerase/thioredoxin
VRGNQIGDLCPTTPLTEINQNGYTDHTFDPTQRGEITVINFWAHWCPPCVNELPHFERVAAEYTDEVDIIAVHCDDVTKAQAFIAENYAESSIIFAMDKENDAFAYYSACGGSGSIPYTVVLDRKGIIRKKFVGAITYDKLVAAIRECL